jgi:hypothetical protein
MIYRILESVLNAIHFAVVCTYDNTNLDLPFVNLLASVTDY